MLCFYSIGCCMPVVAEDSSLNELYSSKLPISLEFRTLYRCSFFSIRLTWIFKFFIIWWPGSSGYYQKAGWPNRNYIHHGGEFINITLFHHCIFILLIFILVQVLIRLVGADEHLYTSYVESMQWLEDTDVLEMIVDKFSSTVSCISFLCISTISISVMCFIVWNIKI